MSVLDAAVLVVSAVEGIQPQTPLLMRALLRLHVPTLLFINKIDRAGADTQQVLVDLRDRLGLDPVALGTAADEGTREAVFIAGHDDGWRAAIATALADNDDPLLEVIVEGGPLPQTPALMTTLAEQTRALVTQPAGFGSALTGVGINELMNAIATLLPAAEPDADVPLSARVFKIERTADRARLAFVRVYSGTLTARQQVTYGDGKTGRVLQMDVYRPGVAASGTTALAGQIAAVQGLTDVRVGDFVGERRLADFERQFPPPTLESVVEALDKRDQAASCAPRLSN